MWLPLLSSPLFTLSVYPSIFFRSRGRRSQFTEGLLAFSLSFLCVTARRRRSRRRSRHRRVTAAVDVDNIGMRTRESEMENRREMEKQKEKRDSKLIVASAYAERCGCIFKNAIARTYTFVHSSVASTHACVLGLPIHFCCLFVAPRSFRFSLILFLLLFLSSPLHSTIALYGTGLHEQRG